MNIKSIEKVKDKLFDVEFEFTDKEYMAIVKAAAEADCTPQEYLTSLMERGV